MSAASIGTAENEPRLRYKNREVDLQKLLWTYLLWNERYQETDCFPTVMGVIFVKQTLQFVPKMS